MNEKWFYLYRAIDKYGDTLDVYFSPKRNRHAAYEFLKHVLKPYPSVWQPKVLNTDKHAAYVKQRQIKTLNNRIEWDYDPIKKAYCCCG